MGVEALEHSKYMAGQKVNVKEYGNAVIIREGQYETIYIVSQIGKKGKVFTWTVMETEIQPYVNVCWKCGGHVNSSADVTCGICHWVVCPSCKACKEATCEPDNIPMDIKLPIKENRPLSLESRAANAEFYGRFYQGF